MLWLCAQSSLNDVPQLGVAEQKILGWLALPHRSFPMSGLGSNM